MSARVRLGVLGWPVGHSRSPAMQNAALRAAGLTDWHYGLLPVAPECLADTVRALPGAGFRGANVTIPHKAAALALADVAGETARATGAANTLLFEPDGTVRAENTDAPALIAALPFPARGRSALVLGAGGTARSAVWALREAGAGPIWVWNRTPERARELATEFGVGVVETSIPADLLIQCTSSGLDGAPGVFKDLPVDSDAVHMFGCVVDYVYRGAHDTELIAVARARSMPVVDGLDLLLGQGALSFEQFTGRRAPIDVMRGALRG